MTPEQLAERKNGVGGSDVGPIVGLSQYKSVHDVYMDKLSLVPDFEGNIHTEFGNRLESVVMDWYQEQHPEYTIERSPAAIMLKGQDWARANLDGIATTPGGSIGVVEIKTADPMTADQWGKTGTDDIPDSYLCQVQWYMLILGAQWCDLAVLIGKEFREYRVQAQPVLHSELYNACHIFWYEHVEEKVAPPVDGSDGCLARLALNRAHKLDMAATEDMDARALRLKAISDNIKELEAEKGQLKNELADLLGDKAKKIVGTWGSYYWTNPQAKTAIDYKAACEEANVSDVILAKYSKSTSRKPSFQPRFK